MSTNGQEQVAKVDPRQGFRGMIERVSRDFLTTMLDGEEANAAAGRVALAFRMLAIRTPELYDLDPSEIGYAVAMCAATNLMPGGALPDVWLIPRRQKVKLKGGGEQWVNRLNWQISARGLVKIANRAGWELRAEPVFAGETFRVAKGLRPNIDHEPDWTRKYEDDHARYADLQLMYVVGERMDGTTKRPAFVLIAKDQIEKRRALAETDSLWSKWPMEMAAKTALSYAVKRGLVPVEAVQVAVGSEDVDPRERIVVAAQQVEVPKPEPRKVASGGMAAVRAAIEQQPVVDPEPEAAEPEAAEPEAKPEPPTPKATVPKPDPEKDGEKLWQTIAERYKDWKVPLRFTAAKEMLKAALGADRLSDERVAAAIAHTPGRWHLTDQGRTLTPGPAKPPAQDTRTEPMDDFDRLLAEVEHLETACGIERMYALREGMGLGNGPIATEPPERVQEYRDALRGAVDAP